jgi:zinc transport system permease protein
MRPPEPEAALGWSDFVAGLDLFVDPLLCGAVAGLVLGYLGVYIVLRRMVFISAAITHSAGLGVALAFYAQLHLGNHLYTSPIVGAFVFGLGATLILAVDPERIRLTRESVIGLVFIFTSGAVLLVGDRIAQESHDIHAILFGTAVMVSKSDLYSTLAAGALVLGGLLWLRRGLVYTSFDAQSAHVQQLPVRLLNALLLLGIGLFVSVTTRALGAMPVFAFSVLPPIAALSVSRRIGVAFVLAALLGALAALSGYVLSFFLRLPVGATQTVVAAVFAGLGMALGRVVRRRV